MSQNVKNDLAESIELIKDNIETAREALEQQRAKLFLLEKMSDEQQMLIYLELLVLFMMGAFIFKLILNQNSAKAARKKRHQKKRRQVRKQRPAKQRTARKTVAPSIQQIMRKKTHSMNEIDDIIQHMKNEKEYGIDEDVQYAPMKAVEVTLVDQPDQATVVPFQPQLAAPVRRPSRKSYADEVRNSSFSI